MLLSSQQQQQQRMAGGFKQQQRLYGVISLLLIGFVLVLEHGFQHVFHHVNAVKKDCKNNNDNHGSLSSSTLDYSPLASYSQTTTTSTTIIDETFPKLAWLMSFPNSGTSYTSLLMKKATKMKTASNYGIENINEYGESVPLYEDDWNGPFISEPIMTQNYSIPLHYVLTKTHCGGRCSHCGPKSYIETTHSFKRKCLQTRYYKYAENGDNNNEFFDLHGHYDESRVTKAIHLIRNPFDNVVSRFHLAIKKYKLDTNPPNIDNKTVIVKRYHNTTTTSAANYHYNIDRERFRMYCRVANEKYEKEERKSVVFDDEFLDILANVPCRADFLRYVEWHNLAFITTQDLSIDTFVLHYENYANNFYDTVDSIVDYLQLQLIENYGQEIPDFIDNKEYAHDYFTLEERHAVKIVLEQMSQKITWKNIQHYFD